MSLQERDTLAQSVGHGPRVALADIENRIAYEHTFNLGEALNALGHPTTPDQHLVTIAAITHTNGFTSIGFSACAAPENYKKDVGEKFAREDALKKFWPLMGYHLREMIHSRSMRAQALGN